MRHGFTALAAILTLAVSVPAAAQESEGERQQAQERPKAKKPRPSRNLITKEQIDEAVKKGATSTYDVILQLRRQWFRVRSDLTAQTGVDSYAPNRPAVYIDNNLMGDDPELLRQFKPESVQEIRFLSGPDATTLFGTGYPHGVIQVITTL
jgi:hypothetical protein